MRPTTTFVAATFSALVIIAGCWLFFSYFVYESYKPVIDMPHECKQVEELLKKPAASGDAAAGADPMILGRLNIICQVKKTDFWYRTNGRISQVLYSYSTLSIIILSFLTALFVGAELSKKSETWRVVTLALPLLSTAIAALTSQFHLQESWALRETGRIQAEEILTDAEALTSDPIAFAKAANDIRTRLSNLEKAQASQYFAYRFLADGGTRSQALEVHSDASSPQNKGATAVK
ncbi:DUF4231 domain-containing protein [Rhizobium tubonense]|uniref:DUF4231 domain-containing protein n=1 Tax=Rhizobium tubonense TaxID=484088 RepID=A0A2W4DV79_9HYPH|nr:DUF4231 domain-containing protein [Rhizobium tubonense]PZM07956.1 hypothetical protein CPY51_29795 [Rhizobium tubonense]